MPYFIKQKAFSGYNTAGEEVTGYRMYSDDELRDIAEVSPSKVFEVSESHAQQVLRKQSIYQELTGETLEAYRTTVLPVEPVEVDTNAEAIKLAESIDPAVLAELLRQHGGGGVQEINPGPEVSGTAGGVQPVESADASSGDTEAPAPVATGGASTPGATTKPTTGTSRLRNRSRKGGTS